MAVYHEDVMSTPPDLLVMAFDLIKSKTLQGRPYQRSNVPDVSLELKKFLSSSTEDQMALLQAEKERLSIAERSERDRRRAAEDANILETADKAKRCTHILRFAHRPAWRTMATDISSTSGHAAAKS